MLIAAQAASQRLNMGGPVQSKKVHFTKEKETMLITLYSRALHSATKNPVLSDPWAQKEMDQIDYDFSAIKLSKVEPLAIAIRSKLFDMWVSEWLAGTPESIVLHLGCGLDSRVFRVDPPPTAQWFDIDYPEVIELR